MSFAPHKDSAVSLDGVATAIAKSSALFAVMELNGGGPVLDAIRTLAQRKDVLAYGLSENKYYSCSRDFASAPSVRGSQS